MLREQGAPSTGNINTSQRKSEADTLSPARLASIIKQADQGNVTAYLTLAGEMEERELHYRSVIGTRKLGVSGSPVSVESASDSSEDKALAEDVEQLVQRAEFEGLVIDLMDAVAKSFSCVEIIWQRDAKRWEPTGYEFREQRFFLFDDDTMGVPLLRTHQNPEGDPLTPFKWIVHMPKLASGVPIRCGIARPVAFAYAAKKYTIIDWLAFLDVFGMPVRVGKFPANLAHRKSELLNAVRSIGTNAAGVIPAEMSIEFVESKSGSGGTTLFQQSAEYWDKQISKVVLGQTMSTDDGSSLAQSRTHERVRFDIRKADARAVAATINRDLVKPFVDLNYGPQKAYPKVRIQADEPEDTKALVESVRVFVAMGGKVQMSEIRDRMGLSEPEDGAELLRPESAIAAENAPDPEPADPAAKPGKGDAATEDDKVTGKPGGKNALARRDAFDTTDEQRDDVLDDWEPLLDGNVGRIMRTLQQADSFEAMRAALDELEREAGDRLDIRPLTDALAKETFRLRGIGDATDQVDV